MTKQLRLLLDQDGPIADFDLRFWDLAQDRGWALNIDDPAHQTKRYFTDHIIDKHQRNQSRWLIEGSGWFRHLPPVEGAIDGVRALIAAGVDVWIATKPMEANPTCRDDKGAWVRQYLPELEKKLIITPDKSLLVGDALLDDAIKPDWIPRAQWKPIVFNRPFNGAGSKWGSIERRWDWSMPIADLIEMMS